jgi:hypothetical protein
MVSRKSILVVVILALLLGTTVLALAPSTAKAQDLVAYVFCTLLPKDTGTNLTGEDEVEFFGSMFGVEWQPEYGVYSYCSPVFSGPDKTYTSVRSVLTAYQDEDGSSDLTPGDTQVGVVRQTSRFGSQ